MTSADKKTSITIVAVGPGDPRLLTLRGREALRQADLVVGFKTVLDVVQQWTGDASVRAMSYRDQEQVWKRPHPRRLRDFVASSAVGETSTFLRQSCSGGSGTRLTRWN